MPVIGRTDAEAFEKLNTLQSFLGGDGGLTMLSERLGLDLSAYDLDAPVPRFDLPDTYHGFTRAILAKAQRESMTLRDLANLTGAARGHWVLCGSPETVAETLAQWFLEEAADGFNVMPPYFMEGFTEFVDGVVPLLQRRGLFRREYSGTSLRDHLGLLRPKRPYSALNPDR
jgi:alkanesulfonate monooxygenase SsuD/methylene tetrahydromethanopterin reductase-like flavin-dependent oxidoreductase (luciferase family)